MRFCLQILWRSHACTVDTITMLAGPMRGKALSAERAVLHGGLHPAPCLTC